jgi:hypothetical protein
MKLRTEKSFDFSTFWSTEVIDDDELVYEEVEVEVVDVKTDVLISSCEGLNCN